MSQDLSGLNKSFIAGDTLSAYRVVMKNGTDNEVDLWNTSTSHFIGVTINNANSGQAVAVRLNGTAKCQAAATATITAGVILAVETGTGLVLTATVTTPATGAANHVRIIGIANESVPTNGVLEVILMPQQLAALS